MCYPNYIDEEIDVQKKLRKLVQICKISGWTGIWTQDVLFPSTYSFFSPNIYLFIYLAALGFSCSMQDLRCCVWDLTCGVRDLWLRPVGVFTCSMWTLSCSMWDSLTRDRTRAPCIGSAESQPLDHQGSPSNYILFFFLIIFLIDLYWSIIVLQYWVSFCCTTKWISRMHTYVPISPPSCVSLPSSLSHPSRSSQSTELISLCYAAASH